MPPLTELNHFQEIALKTQVQGLIVGFDQMFLASCNTRLVAGGDEPIYIPASQSGDYNQVVFAHGYFSSALHEIAHWCIAGKQRRRQQDYGYWYVPDGRSPRQQQLFEQVEVKPQALEWIFTQVCQRSFHLSRDNITGEVGQDQHFRHQVACQARLYLIKGLPPRAALWLEFLKNTYGGSLALESFYWDD